MLRNSLIATVLFILGMVFSLPADEIKNPAALLKVEKAAVGGAAWDRIKAIRLQGAITEGGAPGTFVRVIDHRTGHSRTDKRSGDFDQLSGFDGQPWGSANGIFNRIDLPSLVLDAVSSAFIARDGWWSQADAARMRLLRTQTDSGMPVDVVEVVPSGGSPVDVWLDKNTHLIRRLVQHVDGGEQTTTFTDWRTVRGIKLPYRLEETDPTGEKTLYEVKSATVEDRLDPKLLESPPTRPHGTLASATTIPVRRLNGGHVLVPAVINGHSGTLIFDSGAANYLFANSARQFGLEIRGGVTLSGPAGAGENGGFTTMESIQIGEARLNKEVAIVGPAPFSGPPNGIDGLTGYEFLAEFRTTLDYGNSTLTFEPFGSAASPGGVTVPFLRDGHNIYVEATVCGVNGYFRVDTGDAGGVTVFRQFADAHNLFQEGGRPKTLAGGLGGSMSAKEYPGQRFVLAGHELADFTIVVSEAKRGAFASRSLAGNLGAGVLARFRITFDYQAHTLTFSPL